MFDGPEHKPPEKTADYNKKSTPCGVLAGNELLFLKQKQILLFRLS
jgi:hypothetical protein